jgi:hypothetical protein
MRIYLLGFLCFCGLFLGNLQAQSKPTKPAKTDKTKTEKPPKTPKSVVVIDTTKSLAQVKYQLDPFGEEAAIALCNCPVMQEFTNLLVAVNEMSDADQAKNFGKLEILAETIKGCTKQITEKLYKLPEEEFIKFDRNLEQAMRVHCPGSLDKMGLQQVFK